MAQDPPFFAPTAFDTAEAALDQAQRIYSASTGHLRDALQRFVAGEDIGRVRACYPFVRLRCSRTLERGGSRLAYGFVAGPGTYETTLTRPDLFANYNLEQFRLLLLNHGGTLEVGSSNQPIPLHFALGEEQHVEGELSAERRQQLRDCFDLPDLAAMDDGIANGTHERGAASPSRCRCSPHRAWTIRCSACATTPAARPRTSRTSCCSPTTSSTSTSSSVSAMS